MPLSAPVWRAREIWWVVEAFISMLYCCSRYLGGQRERDAAGKGARGQVGRTS